MPRLRSLLLSLGILGGVLPVLASAAASGGNVPLHRHSGDGVTLTLPKKTQAAFKRERLTLSAQGAAKHKKARYSLPDNAGSWNFSTATGTVGLTGTLQINLGKRSVKLSALKFTRPKNGNGNVTALVGGKALQLFAIKGRARVERSGAREILSGVTASLTKAGAAKINKSLHHANAVRSGESLGTITVTVTVTSSSATLSGAWRGGLGLSFARAFDALTHSSGITVVPIPPAPNGLPAPAGTTTIPAADGTAVTFPLAGSTASARFNKGTMTGTIPLAGGLQLDNGAASATLTNPELTLGTGTEGSGLSFEVNGGPESKILDLDTAQLEQAATPNGSLDLKGLLATLSSEGASSLNRALGTHVFTTGAPVGGLTLILPASPPGR